MQYTWQEITEIVKGKVFTGNGVCLLTQPAWDTRRIGDPAKTLFFALPGSHRQGSEFVHAAAKAGVRNFVVPDSFDVSSLDGCNVICVPDVLAALQDLAAYHRSRFTGPVIGITGSNGKTIVKEWLHQLLGEEFYAYRSPRSFNSQIGVAVSLLGIEPWHKMAIIEAGISKPGEMKRLWRMIKPNLTVCTHLGSAHDEGFENREQKALEKAELFKDADVVIYPGDSDEVKNAVQHCKRSQPLTKFISWGRNEGCGYRMLDEEYLKGFTRIKFIHRSTEHCLDIPFSDKASVENAMSCLCTLAALERWDASHVEQFRHLHALENRLAFTEGRNGNYLVNDSYSNDPDSLQVALDFMVRQQPDKPACVILSDMDQSDADKGRLSSQIADILKQKGVYRLLLIGEVLAAHKEIFTGFNTEYFIDTAALINSGRLDKISGEAILIKGSRRFGFEKIHTVLKKQLHKTHLQIDLEALRHNFRFFRNAVSPKTLIMAMVKAFGYGSGSFEVARTLQFMGVDYLAVAFADEGVALREAGIQTPIMVMNTGAEDMASRMQYNLEPVVFDEAGLLSMAQIAEGKEIAVHLELDTGMHRLGFLPGVLKDVAKSIPANVRVASLFTHLAASEDPEQDTFTLSQISQFSKAADAFEAVLGYAPLRHALNTGGILRFAEHGMDMVRLGVGLYGVDPRATQMADLKPVTTLFSSISQLHTLQPGEGVGYGRRSVADTTRVIATLPVGYADGLRRSLGNGNWHVLVKGRKAPIVGSVCMDMCMVDVTGIDCHEGDEVVIFGADNTVAEMAVCASTIPYEILTGISSRVPREYVGEG
ncbi:MAG: bifunctional UDP-N-acetylmuramoyl-tripeptide:D-alanyl-D-alanine ligase/alanine racemase [Bacteroidetes bacterium]|nr:bifunctional UDP-N-acetylmuramoyl-tripeptide:D-alanyl-D-alanine ligase/alanine racemase [Bacteroidota bacterium]